MTLTGLAYLLIAKPEKNSTAPEGDAIEVANAMRARRAAQTLTAQTDEDRQTAAAES